MTKTHVEQALREALEWALEDKSVRDILPPPGIVLADQGAFIGRDGEWHVPRRLIINDAYLDSLREKP